MSRSRGNWINLVGGLAGALFIVLGVLGLLSGFSIRHTFAAVLGFLIVSWAVLDYRRYQRGTPESELDGGHTIE
jgi:hypothetical protein